VPVALPEGIQPLSPDDIAKLTAAAVDSIDDAQLAKALEVVGDELVAATP
jgi:hypothetical protein